MRVFFGRARASAILSLASMILVLDCATAQTQNRPQMGGARVDVHPERSGAPGYRGARMLAKPAPLVEQPPPPPRAGMRWRRGHWAWRNVNWFWVNGVYLDGDVPSMPDDLVETPPPPPSDDASWVPGYWEWVDGSGWIWASGVWLSP